MGRDRKTRDHFQFHRSGTSSDISLLLMQFAFVPGRRTKTDTGRVRLWTGHQGSRFGPFALAQKAELPAF